MDRREFLGWVGVASGASLLGRLRSHPQVGEAHPVPRSARGRARSPARRRTWPRRARNVRRTAVSRRAFATRARSRWTATRAIRSTTARCASAARPRSTVSTQSNRIRQPLMKDASGKLVPATWEQALPRIAGAMRGGSGEHAFSPGAPSGSFSALMEEFSSRTGVRRLPEFELFSYAAIREANRSLFDQRGGSARCSPTRRRHRHGGRGRHGDLRQPGGVLARTRRGAATAGGPLHWYHVEPHASMTGFKADAPSGREARVRRRTCSHSCCATWRTPRARRAHRRAREPVCRRSDRAASRRGLPASRSKRSTRIGRSARARVQSAPGRGGRRFGCGRERDSTSRASRRSSRSRAACTGRTVDFAHAQRLLARGLAWPTSTALRSASRRARSAR